MSELNNGQLLKEIHDRVIRLDEQMVAASESLKGIAQIFAPNGTCDKSRRRVDSIASHIKIQWWLIGGIAGSLITLAVFIIRTKVGG